ncbi:Beta-lactamase OXA-2 precursor [Thiorhodovibrio winogradskyi]|uniref:beta-lactamase n=1 Tax=Thiorhodovibrio winogradskyi TaxID=77007 RepID=A0ABZ0S9T0_9GAMM|nr:class D beta-lactamase [Thiorhodovibrio winogradskyi]
MKYLLVVASLLLSVSARAEDPSLAKVFAERDIQGTIVISSLDGKQRYIHDEARAQQRFPCASTFKILNTLIALEEKVVSGKDDRLEWDGQVHDFPDWNQDQTLESAFKVSCVWCYQDFARAIGAETYRRYLAASAFGELHEPFDETTFWLDGSLQISAVEQVRFLQKMYRRELPFSPHAYATLREIMLVEERPGYRLWAKTGWAMRADPPIGWYVGYVETPNNVWFFATNIDIRDQEDLSLRQKLTREALYAKGVIQ